MKRVILKLSGEALFNQGTGYDDELIKDIAKQIKELLSQGLDLGIVIGGGNYWRGRTSENITRGKADQIGMLATVMNCIYVSEIFRATGIKTEIFTPFPYSNMTKVFSIDAANELFESGHVLFFAGGTGHPYFSTDTAIALRAAELSADGILLAKNIDGVYDSDPMKNPDAKKFDVLTLDDMVSKQLQVIDLTASVLCQENSIPLMVFDLKEENSIIKALLDSDFTGTKVIVG